MKLSSLFLELKKSLKGVYPNSDVHLFNLTEKYTRPCFLINPILNNRNLDNYYLVNKVLSIEIMCFMPLMSNNGVSYKDKFDLLEKLEITFGTQNINVENRHLNFEFEIKEIDGETSVILDFNFYDDKPLLIEKAELIQKVFLNEKEI